MTFLHITNAYYVMDCDVRLPNQDRLPFSIVFEVQFNLASLTRPGIRIILVSCGLKIVTESKKKDLSNVGVRKRLIVSGTIHRTAVSVYSHQLPCVEAGLCKPCQRCRQRLCTQFQRHCQKPSRQHVLNASYTLTQILCTTTTCHVMR